MGKSTLLNLIAGLDAPDAASVTLNGIDTATLDEDGRATLQEGIRSRPPILLIHGTEDGVVPFRSLDLATRALTAADVPVETQVSPGVAHSVGQDGLAVAAAFAARALA